MSPPRWARKLFNRSTKPSFSRTHRGPEPSQGLNADSVRVERSSQTADTGEIHHQSSSANDHEASFHRISLNDLKMRSCITCFRTLPESEFPNGRILESCQHEPVICLDCLAESIVKSVDADLPRVIGCRQCGVPMSPNDVWQFCRTRILERSEIMLRLIQVQECVICVETLPIFRFPEAKVTDTCSHESNTCLECVNRHIQSQLESRMWDQLNCPECPALLRYTDVQKVATQATFQTYDFLTMKHVVSSDPYFRWCTAAGCSSGQVHPDGAESPLIVCNSCRGFSCFTHQSPWHNGMTCLQVDNPEAAGNTPQLPKAPISSGFLSNIANNCHRWITVGWIGRKETNEEKRDRQLAMRLEKEQSQEEKTRLPQIARGGKQQWVEAITAAEQQESERLARKRQREMKQSRKESERQAREARQIRVRQRKEESATTSLLQKNTKECPGACGWRIEKNHGCDHMTC